MPCEEANRGRSRLLEFSTFRAVGLGKMVAQALACHQRPFRRLL
jgi:hypothetical protein